MPTQRKPYASDVTDAQWAAIADLASLPPAPTGRKRVDQREAFNACLYVLSTGCRWADLPHDFGLSDSTAYRYLMELKRRKRLALLLERLKGEAEQADQLSLKNGYLDASVIKSKRGRNGQSGTRVNTASMG